MKRKVMPFCIDFVYDLCDLLTEDEMESFNAGDWPFTFGDCAYSLITPTQMLNAIDEDDEFATLRHTLHRMMTESATNWYISL